MEPAPQQDFCKEIDSRHLETHLYERLSVYILFPTRERTFTRSFSFSIFRHSTLLRYTLWRITPMYLLFSYQYLRNKKHVPCFYRVIETRVKVWENEKCCANTSRRREY